MKQLMLGNAAVARGLYEAGVSFASSYPGTPSTEITEELATYPEVYAEWAPNEKVACEASFGASLAGVRSFSAMKHVGLNVAADLVYSASYSGVNGGFVIAVADDQGMHSSQNEQDSRNHAKGSKVPMLEPSDSSDCLNFAKIAYNISESFDTPVFLRMTTRVAHSQSPVELGERILPEKKPYEKNVKKYVMMPAMARPRHFIVEDRTRKVAEYAFQSGLNKVIPGSKKIGIVAAGIAYQYAREALGDQATYLKLGMVYPLSAKDLSEFAASVEKVYVIEELDSFIEDFMKANGIACEGKSLFSLCGEYTPAMIREAILGETIRVSSPAQIPVRPPVMCPGCPHRGFFYEVARYGNKLVTSADIGCYTLGSVPPLGVNDSVLCMGASVSAGIGFEKAFEKAGDKRKVISVIGDSTFFHSGITGLIDAVVNKAAIIVNILDNRITAMTGQQENPGTGRTLMGEETVAVDLEALCLACGIKRENLRVVDPYNLMQTREALKAGVEASEPFVIITKRPCALIKKVLKERATMKCKVDTEKCIGCKLCLKAGCPAVMVENGKAKINTAMCNGCEVCAQICPKQAIAREDL